MKDDNLRKAVLYCIDQNAIIAGNVWNADLAKAREYMNAYLASK